MNDTAFEVEMDGSEISAAAAAMLTGLLEEDKVLGKRGPKVKIDVGSMSREERLAHNAALTKARRAKKSAMKASGSLPFDEATARDALADAAIMILRTGTAGSNAIVHYLEKVYSDKVGVPIAIQARVKSGKLAAKLIGFAEKSS